MARFEAPDAELGDTLGDKKVLRRLHTDHVRMASVLVALEKVMREPELNFERLTDLVDYVAEYPQAVHHPLEDQLFDRMVNKGLIPSEHRLVSVNVGQHVEISEATQAFAVRVAAVATGAEVARALLREHADGYIDLQRSHMLVEERRLFPLAERIFTAEDWVQLEDLTAAVQDPLFDERAGRFEKFYGYIMEAEDGS